MTLIAAVVSLVSLLLLPGPPIKEKDCHRLLCLPGADIPPAFNPPPGDDPPAWNPPDDDDDGPPAPAPTECTPRDPGPAEPDVAEMPMPRGELIHSAGSGPVVVGMDTEYVWRGPRQVTWSQPGRDGVREDCSSVPADSTEFTATLRTVVFEFEQGERKRYFTDTGKVTHRYTTIPADEGEELFTVCVYAAYEIPGEGFETLTLVEELDHEVVEIRSTLIE
jgi:hypothetical protein